MPEIKDKAQYDELVRTMNRLSEAYYDKDSPEITDAEYDAMTRDLKAAEALHPEWADGSSPTRHVGGTSEFGVKTKHRFKLLSLDDKFSKSDVTAWHDALGCPVTVVEQKIDGLTVALTYKNGWLNMAATRGDGTVGEAVTAQAMRVAGIPIQLNLPDGVEPENEIIVRAEVCQPVAEFLRTNALQESMGKPLFANPRNCTAGSLRQKDPNVTASRGLKAIAFQIIDASGWDKVRGHTQSEDVALLGRIGFIPVTQHLCRTQEAMLAAIDAIGESRDSLPYWTDGAVVKVNDRRLQARIGATEKYPLHAVAYKYPAEKKTTVIRRIDVTVGRTGVLTPVAEFDPVQLGGSTVTHATMHNQKFISDRKLNVGAKIEVIKSGEIIPKIVGVPKPSDTPFRIERCPACGAIAVLSADENGSSDTEVLVCPNLTGCPAQKLRYLQFFASKDVMDIKRLGDTVLSELMERNIVRDVTDLYDLRYRLDEILAIPRIGEKKVDAVLESVEKSKSNPMDRVLKSLGIPGIGRHAGRALAERYPDLDAVFAADIEALQSIDGIGPVSAAAIKTFATDPAAYARYETLKAKGVNVKSDKFMDSGTKHKALAGLRFCITGSFGDTKRDEIQEKIRAAGGIASGSVSKSTDYLVAGDAAGSKLEKARALGTKIITLGDLMAMMENQEGIE